MDFSNAVAGLFEKTPQGSWSVIDEMLVASLAIGAIETAFRGITLDLAVFSMRNRYEESTPRLKYPMGFPQG